MADLLHCYYVRHCPLSEMFFYISDLSGIYSAPFLTDLLLFCWQVLLYGLFVTIDARDWYQTKIIITFK
jgi:hypothetical protein